MACHDLRAAIRLAGDPEIIPNNVGFSLQQAVEKATKALILRKKRRRSLRDHDLERLFRMLAEHVAIPDDFKPLKVLNPYAVELRYDLYSDEAEEIDPRNLIDLVRSFLEWINLEGKFE